LAYEVNDDVMLCVVPELLNGQAILWFRNNEDTWDMWESFLICFKKRYLPVDRDDVLMDEIRITQGADESIAVYDGC
jgi:hypothetical protein